MHEMNSFKIAHDLKLKFIFVSILPILNPNKD